MTSEQRDLGHTPEEIERAFRSPTVEVDWSGAHYWGRTPRRIMGAVWHIISGGIAERIYVDRRSNDHDLRAEIKRIKRERVAGSSLCKPNDLSRFEQPVAEQGGKTPERVCLRCTSIAERRGIEPSEILPLSETDDEQRVRLIEGAIENLTKQYRAAPSTVQLRAAAGKIEEFEPLAAAFLRRTADDYEASVEGIRDKLIAVLAK